MARLKGEAFKVAHIQGVLLSAGTVMVLTDAQYRDRRAQIAADPAPKKVADGLVEVALATDATFKNGETIRISGDVSTAVATRLVDSDGKSVAETKAEEKAEKSRAAGTAAGKKAAAKAAAEKKPGEEEKKPGDDGKTGNGDGTGNGDAGKPGGVLANLTK